MQTVREILAGDTMDVCVYTRATRWDGPKDKAKKAEWRKEANKKLSLRLCREKLEQRITCNFGPGDWHITLTMGDWCYSADFRRLRSYWRLFIRNLSADRAKRGLPKPVYIYVMEGIHGDKRLHMHVLLKAEEGDVEAVTRLWTAYGAALLEPLATFEHRDNLAGYLSKEPAKFGRTQDKYRERNLFVASHNCRKPERHRYSLQDGLEWPVPEGWRVEYSDRREAPCGRYRYYHLARIK